MVGDDYQTIYSFTGASPELPAGVPRALPGRHGRAPRGELPLHAAGAGGGERARARARRVREGLRADADPTVPTPRPGARRPRRRGRVRRRRGPAPRTREGVAVRGDGGALPDQRALRAVRGGVRRRRASRTRCATARSCAGPGRAAVLAAAPPRPTSVERGRRGRGRHRRASATTPTPIPTTPRRSPARPTSGGCARSPPSTQAAHADGDVRRVRRRARPRGSAPSRPAAA